MVDQEVVDVLAEIKHRITAKQTAAPLRTDGELAETPVVRSAPEKVNRYPSLVVLARAWDRLPPVVSNRTGATASLELWLKRKLRRALRWITWEQVNFNAATQQTFLELIDSLNATDQRLSALENQLARISEALQSVRSEAVDEAKKHRAELRSELATHSDQLERFRAEIARHHAEVNSERALANSQRGEFEQTIKSLIDKQKADFDAVSAMAIEQTSGAKQRLTELLDEFRERDERLLDEQRVCFKQLALELTESQVLQDRTRRELDARVTKLESES